MVFIVYIAKLCWRKPNKQVKKRTFYRHVRNFHMLEQSCYANALVHTDIKEKQRMIFIEMRSE